MADVTANMIVRMRNQTAAGAAGVRSALSGISAQAKLANKSMRGFGKQLFSDDAVKKFGKLRRSVKNLQGDFGKLKGTIGSALAPIGAVAGVGAIAGIGAAAVGGGFFKSVVQTGAQFEKYQATLRTLEGSNDKAEKSFDWVKKFAQTTPFQIDKVMESFIRMRAYGMDPMDGSLRTLGDTAAAMGKDVIAAVEMMADAVVAGGERLKEFGLRQSVKGNRITYTGRTKSGEMVTFGANKNDQADIQNKLIEFFKKYEGQMRTMSGTTAGMISNISDAWTNFKGMIASAGLGDVFKSELRKVLKWIDRLTDSGKLEEYARDISDVMIHVVDSVSDAAVALKEFATQGWPAFKESMKSDSDAFEETIDDLKSIVGEIRFVVDSIGGWREAIGLLIDAWLTFQALKIGWALASVVASIGGVTAAISGPAGWIAALRAVPAAAGAAAAATSAAATTGAAGAAAGATGAGAAAAGTAAGIVATAGVLGAGIAGGLVGYGFSKFLEETNRKAKIWKNESMRRKGWKFSAGRAKDEFDESSAEQDKANIRKMRGLMPDELTENQRKLIEENEHDPVLRGLAMQRLADLGSGPQGKFTIQMQLEAAQGTQARVVGTRARGKTPKLDLTTAPQMGL